MSKLKESIIGLIRVNPFYAHLISKFNIIETNEVPTMGVSVTTKINLAYNKDFVEKHNVLTLGRVLQHECRHLIQEHINRAKQLGIKNEAHFKLFNVATDAVINVGDLEKLADDLGGVTVKRLNKELEELTNEFNAKDGKNRVFQPLEPNELAEYYFSRLLEFQQENKEHMSGSEFGYSLDDHDEWQKSENSSEVIKEIVKKAVNDAIKESGKIPNELVADIQELNKSQINWRQQLRNFNTAALKTLRESTRKKRNRRYGILQPGVKKLPQLNVVVCVDTSRSMAGEPLKQAWGELEAINNALPGVSMTVIEADCVVHSVYKFNPRKTPEFKGSGGTLYTPAIEEAKKLKPDVIIYIGDLDSADTPKNPNLPFLWVATGGHSNPPGNFGKLIRIELSK